MWKEGSNSKELTVQQYFFWYFWKTSSSNKFDEIKIVFSHGRKIFFSFLHGSFTRNRDALSQTTGCMVL